MICEIDQDVGVASLMFANEFYFLLSNNKRHMNKMYSIKNSLLLFIIIFINTCQIALAQTVSVSSDMSKAIVSADVSKSADASADVSAVASKPGNTPITIPLTTVALKLDPTKEYERKIRNRSNEIFNRVDYRAIKYIKWPQDKLKKNPFENPAETMEEKKSIADEYCRMFASQYAGEAEKSLGLPKGTLILNHVCDVMQIALRNVNDVEDIALAGAWILKEFDRELFRQYHFGNYKSYKKTFFGIVGIPFNYSDLVMQILILLSLGLNFFALYKVLRER